MLNKKPTLLTIIFLLAIALTACGANAAGITETASGAGEPTMEPAIHPGTETPAPVSTDTPTPQPTETSAATEPSASSVSFARDVTPILESRCLKCHGGEQTKEGLDMKTYDNLMVGSDGGPVITPGNADESLLVQQLLEGKMPKRGPKLTPDQIQIIADWINAGASNN